MKIPFFGASYTLDSLNAEAQSTINLIPEVIESQAGKAVGRMRGTPGLSVFATLPGGPVRGLWSGEGMLFAAAKDATGLGAWFQIYSDGTWDFRGNIADDGKPVLIFPNGQQLMVVSAGNVYFDNGGPPPSAGPGIVEISPVVCNYTDLAIPAGNNMQVSSAALPFTPEHNLATLVITGGTGFTAGSYTILSVDGDGNATLNNSPGTPGSTNGAGNQTVTGAIGGTGASLDTYGIAAPAHSRKVYISALNNFGSWQTIDENDKEGYPDNILAMLADHEELYLFGDLESTEIWQDTGAANFPFQRMQGGLMHFGLAAQYTPVRLGMNGVAWLAWSANRGGVQAVYAQGFVPQRVSTHAIEQVWRGYSRLDDAIAYSYMEDGHDFWVIHFPSGDATWVYDYTASQQTGMPMWHQRGYWDGATLDGNGQPVLHRQLQMCHTYGYLSDSHSGSPTYIAPEHYVGDYTSGNVYLQSLTNWTDNGKPIVRQRACPHQSQENLRTFYSRFQLDAEVGNQDIAVTFDYSRDFGHTFINAITLTAPATGGYIQRLIWRRLGNARDLVPRITITSAAKIALVNAFMDAIQGAS